MNPFLDAIPDLTSLRETIWQELTLATSDSDEPWFLGVFGTLGLSSPELRTLVLRRVEQRSRSLIWHTDLRSEKFSQLERAEATSVHFWNPIHRVQLVVRGESQTFSSGDIVDQEWESSQLSSRRAYLGEFPPGTESDTMTVNFPAEFETRPPTETESQAGKQNFGVISTVVREMDLLILRQTGNVRAKYCWNDHDLGKPFWEETWVCP